MPNLLKKLSNTYLTFTMFFLFSLTGILSSNAQIGYQVALINNATGEPRAMENVSVNLSITNNEGKTLYSGTQSATTNDFGILSLSVGDANTFKNVDWTKLPFFISAEVDGILIGKTQILSVPVAEYAKATGQLTIQKLCSKSWKWNSGIDSYSFSFNTDGTGEYTKLFDDGQTNQDYENKSFKWDMNGNCIVAICGNEAFTFCYHPQTGSLSMTYGYNLK